MSKVKKSEQNHPPAPNHFLRAEGLDYIHFLRKLHEANRFDWYLEIGCRRGRSFAPVKGKTIAIDPFFRINRNVIWEKPALLLFQQTSDAFFDDALINFDQNKIGLSFLDGMHLFEYLLRDFMNVEERSHQNSVIMMHDCCPYNLAMTTRDLDNIPSEAWTGDVWKLIPILTKYRPDLQIDVLDCVPTGLVVVSNLDPQNKVLRENYNEIVDEFMELDIVEFGLSNFNALFEYTDATAVVENGFPQFENAKLTRVKHIKPKLITP